MDARKTIERYIKPSLFQKLAAWLTVLLFAACLLTGIAKAAANGKANAVAINPAEAEEYAPYYVDVVGLSDWFLKEIRDNRSHEYRIALDSENYLCAVEVSNDEAWKMEAQAAYWRGDTDTPPEPFRLSGWALSIGDKGDLRNQLYLASGVSSYDELEAYFGNFYLSSFKPGAQEDWFVAALVFGLISFFTVIFWLGKRSTTKKCLDDLESRGCLELAAEELADAAPDDRCVLGAHFLFAKHGGIAAPYEGIRQCAIEKKGVKLSADHFLNASVPMKRENVDRLVQILQAQNGEKQ